LSLSEKYVAVLRRVLPAGFVGVCLTLGLSAPGAARENPAGENSAAARQSVSERLSAIREAVTKVSGDADLEGPQRVAAWGNWRNGGGNAAGWRNAGWHNGGWRNGGWHNWKNWHNY
jgi:rSAM-associated Gly-rich repeat protein